MTLHHIISDGWSIGVLVRELGALYRGNVTGEAVELEELKVQYGDFASWQREYLNDEVLEKELDYWKRELEGKPFTLELFSDRPRPAMQTFNGAREPLALSLALTDGLKTLSQRQGVTLFMTLMAAFNVLLFRYVGRTDILVGTPIAGRTQIELETLIGFFANMLVLPADLSRDPTFTDLLGRVRATCLGAYSHQNVPFERLVEELQPARDLSRNPIFQTVFSLQNASADTLELPGLTLNSLKVESRTALFDLMLEMSDSEHGLVGQIEYNTDLFEVTTIRRMIVHFVTLLESVVADPHQRVIDIPLTKEQDESFSAQGAEFRARDEAEQFNFSL